MPHGLMGRFGMFKITLFKVSAVWSCAYFFDHVHWSMQTEAHLAAPSLYPIRPQIAGHFTPAARSIAISRYSCYWILQRELLDVPNRRMLRHTALVFRILMDYILLIHQYTNILYTEILVGCILMFADKSLSEQSCTTGHPHCCEVPSGN